MGSEISRITTEQIGRVAATMGVGAGAPDELVLPGRGLRYSAGSFLFREATPRLWTGVLLEGEIGIRRKLHGSAMRLAVLSPSPCSKTSAGNDRISTTAGRVTSCAASAPVSIIRSADYTGNL